MAQGRVGLPIVEEPKQGESFSSWLTRLACIYGETPQGMIRDAALAYPENSGHVRHPDEPSSDIISMVAERAGVDVNLVESTTIRARNLLLGFKTKPDIVDTVFAGRSVSWCPECLVEDGFWHLWWTSPAVIACPKHRRSLIRHCPACRTVPRARVPWPASWDVMACAECGGDLSQVSDVSEQHPSIIHWCRILMSANGTHIELPKGDVLSVYDFLSAIEAIQAVLHPWYYARDDYDNWACWQLGSPDALNQAMNGLVKMEGELITSHSINTSLLFHVLGWLFSDWEHNITTFWEKLDIARKRLLWERRAELASVLSEPLKSKFKKQNAV